MESFSNNRKVNQEEIRLKNIQTAYAAQYQKNKQPNQNNGGRCK